MSSLDYLELCRLCLVKDNVSLPIFEDEGDERQIYFKISSCLPVKVLREDKLPKKICDECGYKVELLYQFWNTSVNAEKQLLQWLGEVGGLEDKQDFVTEVLDPSVLKQDRSGNTRLDGNVLQVSGQGNIDINMIDNMSIITIPAGSEQQFTTVPMDTSVVQAVAGPSTQVTHEQLVQSQADVSQIVGEESEEDNYDDGCDNDDGMAVKEETEEDHNEQSTFANVSLPCDEAGPSGLQQSELTAQTADGDHKSGYYLAKIAMLNEAQQKQEISVTEEEALLLDSAAAAGLAVVKHEDSNGASSGLMVMPPGGLLTCALCDDAFVDEANLEFHLKCQHGADAQLPQQHHEEIVTDETTVMMYACERCPAVFPDECSYQKHQQDTHDAHLQQHKPQQYQQQEQQQQQAQPQPQPSQQQGWTPHKCPYCIATFRYKQGLRLHRKIHESTYDPPLKKKFECDICRKGFCRRQVLLVHKRTHDGSAASSHEFVCSVCNKAVSSRTYLNVHMRMHTGEKPHQCDMCEKRFASTSYLNVHRRTHTGERPHKCPYCDKRFTQRTTMIVHERTHTGERPYPCNVCPRMFASKTMLNSHLKTHQKRKARNDEEQRTLHMHLQQQQQILLLTASDLQESGVVDKLVSDVVDVQPESEQTILISTVIDHETDQLITN